MSRLARWAWPVALVLAAGCATNHYVHTVQPLPVVVNPASGIDWGLDLAIDFADAVKVALTNSGSEPITVRWDESTYIDVDNRSHPVLTSAQQASKKRQAAEPAAASVIAPGSRLDEILKPVPHALDSGADPLLPGRDRAMLLSPGYLGDPKWRPSKANESLVNKEIGVFLVFERGSDKKSVLAKYRIAQVDLE